MWSWHGKRYLGGAHGVAGILHILLKCPPSVLSDHFGDILDSVSWLVHCQDQSGNWPTKAPANMEDGQISELVQWCHGAPGVAILLSTVLRLSQNRIITLPDTMQGEIIESLHLAGNLIYKRGFLRKGVGLCHGVGGSVYALLAISDVLDAKDADKGYFAQAAHLAHLAVFHEAFEAKGEMGVPDHPWSMYEGLAGMCCAWGEIVSRLQSKGTRKCCGLPGFDDI
ncbi:hypothetical protein M422DRAFT_197113 [Sphaerobolus stellatus SS14]|uniref:Uncharacterized protein n=1 Tax=Sphaerobolus stellatus (strain SS14) TaxID=990650 RepID=A0A0C9T175_SPHS4|nr:hypothetical protein M422DRAFT_197113 [Sphaerobolus stellatus SS14]